MTILAATRLYNGVLPSPQLRKMAASKLYSDKKRQAQQEDAQILFGHIVDVWRHFQDPEGRIDDEFADDGQQGPPVQKTSK